MLVKSHHFLSVLIVICAGLVLYRLQAKWIPSAEPAARLSEIEVSGLVVQARHLAVGEVWEQKSFVCQMPIENRTANAISIKRFYTSCGCVSVEPKSLTIPARETRTIAVALDLRHPEPSPPDKAVRAFSESIEPMLDQDASHSSPARQGVQRFWTFEGSVRSRVTFDASTLGFGTQVFGAKPVARKTRLNVHAPFRSLAARIKPDVASVRVVQIKPDQFDVFVAPRTETQPKRFNGELIIELVEDQGARVEAGWLPIDGELVPEVRPVPARLVLPSTKVGETAEAMFLLQPPDAADMVVSAIAIDSPAVQVEPTSAIGVAEGRAFAIRLKLPQRGQFSTKLRFTIRRVGREPTVYPMEVWCRGL